MKVLIACSSGGPLAQAVAVRPWWEQHQRLWVTGPTSDAREKLVDEDVIECAWPTQRNIPNLVRNTWLAHRLLRDFKPDIVFSTGAAVAVPFIHLAHAAGIRSIFLETVDRIDKPSLSGRLAYPVVDDYLTQWRPLHERLPRSYSVGVVL